MSTTEKATNPRTVLLATVDALRADRVLAEPGLAPFVQSLGPSSLVFSRAYSVSTNTPESFPALFCDRYPSAMPSRKGPGVGRPLPADLPTLAQTLLDAGVSTAAFHSNPYLSRPYGYGRGFERFDDDLALSGTSLLAVRLQRALRLVRRRPYVRGAEITRRTLEWTRRVPLRRPLFVWAHYMDVHGPYLPDEEDFAAVSRARYPGIGALRRLWLRAKWRAHTIAPADAELLFAAYRAQVRYVDRCLAGLVEGLRALRSDLAVVVTSDHGEEFGEHRKFDHPNDLVEELLHVPLVVSPAPSRGSGTVASVASTIDLSPTILDLFGLGDAGARRRSLLRRELSDASGLAYSEATGEFEDIGLKKACVTSSRFRYEMAFRDGVEARSELRDLELDPGETSGDASDRCAADADRLRSSLVNHFLEISAASGVEDSFVLSAELRREVEDRLRDLGYIE